MPNMNFSSAFIRHIDVRRKEKSPVFTRIHMTASYTKSIRDAMGWDGEIPEQVESGKLGGALNAIALTLTCCSGSCGE